MTFNFYHLCFCHFFFLTRSVIPIIQAPPGESLQRYHRLFGRNLLFFMLEIISHIFLSLTNYKNLDPPRTEQKCTNTKTNLTKHNQLLWNTKIRCDMRGRDNSGDVNKFIGSQKQQQPKNGQCQQKCMIYSFLYKSYFVVSNLEPLSICHYVAKIQIFWTKNIKILVRVKSGEWTVLENWTKNWVSKVIFFNSRNSFDPQKISP